MHDLFILKCIWVVVVTKIKNKEMEKDRGGKETEILICEGLFCNIFIWNIFGLNSTSGSWLGSIRKSFLFGSLVHSRKQNKEEDK